MRVQPHATHGRVLAIEAATGVAVGVGFGLALIVFDVGQMRTLALASDAPLATVAIVIVGAALTFLPAVIAVVFGLKRPSPPNAPAPNARVKPRARYFPNTPWSRMKPIFSPMMSGAATRRP